LAEPPDRFQTIKRRGCHGVKETDRMVFVAYPISHGRSPCSYVIPVGPVRRVFS
jgi:hypothetical protein